MSVGETLADKLPASDIDPFVYIQISFLNGFVFRGICECEVYDKIMNLKVAKSTIGVPRKCLKLAATHIYEALTTVFNNSLQLGIQYFQIFLKFLESHKLTKEVTTSILQTIVLFLHSQP